MMSPDSSASNSRSNAEIIEAAAAAWLSLRDRGMSPAETTGFLRWLQQDPRHAECFGELDRVWKDFDRLAAAPSAPTGTPDADLLAPRERRHVCRRMTWMLCAAAAAIAAIFTILHLRALRFEAETEIGAYRTLDLPDGSVAQLNTDSAINARFSPAERHVYIARGEAFFSVAKDHERPFLVSAGPVIVRAVGTAFNVRHRRNAVEILVTEGRVQVDRVDDGRSALEGGEPGEPRLLGAGERALIPLVTAASPKRPAATIERVSTLDVQRALAWQERRLEFDSVPLADVAVEFNRYNRRQIVIADPQLAARRFSGTFRADGYESLVRLLELDFGVTVLNDGPAIVLRPSR